MKTFTARHEWLKQDSWRLDATAFGSGALAIRDRIESGPWAVRDLGEVCALFYGSRSARRYVTDPNRGVPFLSSSDMLLADLGSVPLVSKIGTPGLKSLLLQDGWTLVSRSGTVGNTAYVRPEMRGMAASEHAIRAVPRQDLVKPGFLFAYLSSEAGQALLKGKIFGSVVQHIEPDHIADLPIPIAPPALEDRVHRLVQGAADARSEAGCLLARASGHFDEQAGLMPSLNEHAFASGVVRSTHLNFRLDAFHHVGWAAEGRCPVGPKIKEIGQVSRPAMIKRVDAERGVPFVSGIDVYQVRPGFRQRITRIEAERADCLIARGEILVQRGGQRYGLLGRPAYAGERLHGWAASEDLMHVRLHNGEVAGRVFAFLLSGAGHRSLLRSSYGTSIPKLNPSGLEELVVPELPQELAAGASRALRLREQADADEERAIREVEAWLS